MLRNGFKQRPRRVVEYQDIARIRRVAAARLPQLSEPERDGVPGVIRYITATHHFDYKPIY